MSDKDKRRGNLPLTPDYKKEFEKEWLSLQRSDKHDMKLCQDGILLLLSDNRPFDAKWADRPLVQKEYAGCNEISVKGDLRIIYRLSGRTIELVRIGTHPQLFKRMS